MAGGKAPRARGDRFEHACAIRLRTAGYLVVRSAGSFGPADLVALRGDRLPVLVSCKVTDNTTKAARAAFNATAADAGALAVIATKSGRATVWHVVGPAGNRTEYEMG